ncbi:MAG: winged helix-turn-helix domain-containing protein [Fidelibacterota bacterium]
MAKDLKINGQVWVDINGKPFLGKGRIELLKKIKESGSISAAGDSLGMAYRKAWRLVDSMNKVSSHPLVERTVGGKGGGGSVLTQAGEDAIVMYECLESRFTGFLEAERTIFDEMRGKWNT